MEFPKMLYKGGPFADQEAIKAALKVGTLQTLVVGSAAEQEAAEGYTEDLGALIGKRRGRPPLDKPSEE